MLQEEETEEHALVVGDDMGTDVKVVSKFRQGDFEDVLNLIDLYDSAQSDTANYMQDFNDAMLKIVGNLEIDVETAKEMKEHNILMLQTEKDGDGKHGQADADYIYKQYDVAGTEAYKDRVFYCISKFLGQRRRTRNFSRIRILF